LEIRSTQKQVKNNCCNIQWGRFTKTRERERGKMSLLKSRGPTFIVTLNFFSMKILKRYFSMKNTKKGFSKS